jgi:hypothetical protein
MPCSKDCKGCLCHVKAPCDHHTDGHLDDSLEAEADRTEKRQMKEFFFGPLRTYNGLNSDESRRSIWACSVWLKEGRFVDHEWVTDDGRTYFCAHCGLPK